MPSGFGSVKPKYFRLAGGLDLVSSALTVKPGRCLAMVNFEPGIAGGYRRCDGFERFDGRPKPSDATFIGFEIDDGTYLTEGETITGGTSGATGTVVAISGDWVAVTKVTGTFVDGESLNGGVAEIRSEPLENNAPDQNTEDEFLLAAQEEYRGDIDVVPGAGPVRGAWRRAGTVYAIRDIDDSSNVARIYQSSSSGWTTSGITMCQYIYFDAGGAGSAQALPAEGATINGATSGATAIVHRVIEHGGATGTNDAYGYLVLRSVTGTFQNNESLRVGATAFALAAGANATFSLPREGRYRFINHNFFGGSGTRRTYAVNGVGPAFEIDEDHRVSPLLLPLVAEDDQPSANTPFFIAEHRNYLFLAFPGGSLVHTVVGEPLIVNGFLGAAEFGIGDEITSLSSSAGNVLVITTDGFTKGLYGSSPEDWDLKPLASKTGGKLNGVQQLDTVYALDDLGISSLARVQSFGDFAAATVSQFVQPLVKAMRLRLTDSTTVRGSSQVRFYFDDASCLVMYVPSAGEANQSGVPGRPEFGYLSYPFEVSQVYNSEDETGQERTYFVSEDAEAEGLVFEDQIGTSFDGDEIQSYLRLAFNHLGSPSYRKHFHRLLLELETPRQIELQIVQDLAYGAQENSSASSNQTSSDIDQTTIFGAGGFWDSSNWDEFIWDGQSIATAQAVLNGSGENIGFVIFNESAVAEPFTLQGLTIHYSLRRLQR